MMLTIFVVCQSDKVNPGEKDYKVCWNPDIPEVGHIVNMGADDRWKVVGTTLYESAMLVGVIDACLCYVHPYNETAPPEQDWQGFEDTDGMSNQAIEVAISDLTKEFLQFSINFTGEARPRGEQLYSPRQIEGPHQFRLEMLSWWVNHTEEYYALTRSAFPKIFLSYCLLEPIEMATAA